MPSVSPIPKRTQQQRTEALQKANDIRVRRSVLKREVKAGRVSTKTTYDYILDPPDWLATMQIFDLILALPKYGRVRANRVLFKVRMSHSKTLGGMSDRQRQEIVAMLRHP
jgi:hypothetical protein